MTSPIFAPLFIKKYIVQTRYKSSVWQEYVSSRNLEEAKRTIQQLKGQNSEIEARILNRFTGQVIKP